MSVPTSHQKQQVIWGIISSWIVSSLFIYSACQMALFFGHKNEALAFSLGIPALTLMAGIGWAAHIRHFKQNIDGSKPDEGSELDLTLRYISNTSEQLLLFYVATICFWLVGKEETSRQLLPVMAVWFVIARCLFYFGYRLHPLARAFGFSATFHPTILLLSSALYLLLF